MAKVRIYVGTDGKLHFTNSGGADTVLPFNNSKTLQVRAKAHEKGGVQYFYVQIYNNGTLVFNQGGWLSSDGASGSKDAAGYVTINTFTV